MPMIYCGISDKELLSLANEGRITEEQYAEVIKSGKLETDDIIIWKSVLSESRADEFVSTLLKRRLRRR